MPSGVRVLAVRDQDRVELERRSRSKAEPVRLAQRARIVLLSEQGPTGPAIADRVGCSEPTVVLWRSRYAEHGIAGLDDAPRPGGPVTVLTREVTEQILADTLTSPPGSLRVKGNTHWSARRLADWLARHRGIEASHDRIAEVWKRFSLKPHRSEGFKFSTDPELDLLDACGRLVGLLDAPRDAVVLAPLHRREILWRLLNGPHSALVRQIGLADGSLADIARAVTWLRRHYRDTVRVDELAALAGMSPSVFHRHFRAVTKLTPIQYQKAIRLHEARLLLVAGRGDVAEISHRVGYDSTSQFSREYRRHFGSPPGRDGARLRAVA